jgi:hypothetical protein
MNGQAWGISGTLHNWSIEIDSNNKITFHGKVPKKEKIKAICKVLFYKRIRK